MTPEERFDRIIEMAQQLVLPQGSASADIIIQQEPTAIGESNDNGAWVQAWVWVDFAGTELDKET